MPKSLSLSSRSLDIASRDSFEKPESLVSCQASNKPIAGNSLIDEGANSVPCFSFSTRALFTGFLIASALIFGGARLASFSIWISRTLLRLSKRFLVTCSCFLSSIHLWYLAPIRDMMLSVVAPSLSITASQEMDTVRVSPNRNTASNSNVLPRVANTGMLRSATNDPITPPAEGNSSVI